MCKFETGDILDNLIDFDGYFFSACGVIRGDKRLVMGKGFAAEVNHRFPILSRALGQMIMSVGECFEEPANRRYRGTYIYGLIPPHSYLTPEEGGWCRDDSVSASFGAFQTKFHFANPSTVECIQMSCDMLCKWAIKQHKMIGKKCIPLEYALNYPGIGCGCLTRSAVEPLLSSMLPDNITVFSLDNEE